MTQTFDKFEIGELYFTGPASTGYTKISDEKGREIVSGKIVGIPKNRLGHTASKPLLAKLGAAVDWNLIARRAQEKTSPQPV